MSSRGNKSKLDGINSFFSGKCRLSFSPEELHFCHRTSRRNWCKHKNLKTRCENKMTTISIKYTSYYSYTDQLDTCAILNFIIWWQSSFNLAKQRGQVKQQQWKCITELCWNHEWQTIKWMMFEGPPNTIWLISESSKSRNWLTLQKYRLQT